MRFLRAYTPNERGTSPYPTKTAGRYVSLSVSSAPYASFTIFSKLFLRSGAWKGAIWSFLLVIFQTIPSQKSKGGDHLYNSPSDFSGNGTVESLKSKSVSYFAVAGFHLYA